MIKQSQINHFINIIRNHNRRKLERKGSYLNRLKSQDKTIKNKFSLLEKSARHFIPTNHQQHSIKSYQKTPQHSKILQHGKRVKTQVTYLCFNIHSETRPKNFYDNYKQQLQKKNLMKRAVTKKPFNFFTQNTSEINQFFNSRLREYTQFNNDRRLERQTSHGKNHRSLGCGVTVYNQNQKSSLLIKKKVNELTLYDERKKQKTRTQIQAERPTFNCQKDLEINQNGSCCQDNFMVKRKNKQFKIKPEQKQCYYIRMQKGKKQPIVESNIKQMKHMMAKCNKNKNVRRDLQEDDFFNDQMMKLQGWEQHTYFQYTENAPFLGRTLQISI